MKKLLIFVALVYAISCSQGCGDDEYIPTEPKKCHDLAIDDKNTKYCCYYEGHNVDTDKDEKFCWEFEKTKIDNNKVKDTISQIEKGTDSHVTKAHKNVKLDCFASYLKNYFLMGLLLLF